MEEFDTIRWWGSMPEVELPQTFERKDTDSVTPQLQKNWNMLHSKSRPPSSIRQTRIPSKILQVFHKKNSFVYCSISPDSANFMFQFP